MAEPVTVASTDALEPGEGMAVTVDGRGIALFHVDGEYHAIANRCTHVGGSLGNGRLDGGIVACPLHGATFDVRTGRVCSPPADEPVRTFDVGVEDGAVVVYLD